MKKSVMPGVMQFDGTKYFGQRMAAFRIAKGMSQSELVEALGMTRDLVTYYERVAKNPSLGLVKKSPTSSAVRDRP